MYCLKDGCENCKMKKNGIMKLQSEVKIDRYRCPRCGTSKISNKRAKREVRGRKNSLSQRNLRDFKNLYNYAFIRIIQQVSRHMGVSFSDAIENELGLNRSIVLGHVRRDSEYFTCDRLQEIVLKIKEICLDIEDSQLRHRMFYEFFHECGEILIKCVTLEAEKDTIFCSEEWERYSF